MEDWINRMRSSHTMEYFLPRNAMKLIHATTWMKLTLGEICQTEKDKWCMIPLIRGTQTRQIHRQKVMVVAGAGVGGRREMGSFVYRIQFLSCKVKGVL